MNKELIEKLEAFKKASNELSSAWLDNDSELGSCKYPFIENMVETAKKISDWVNEYTLSLETQDADTYQLEVLKEIQNSGCNVVSCGNCGCPLVHRSSDEVINCNNCNLEMELSDCPDIIS